MIAVPGPTATTTPEGETVATAGSDVVQTTLRLKRCPEASLMEAVSCRVAVGTRVALSAKTSIVAAVGGVGPRTLSLPAQEMISQPRASDPTNRCVVTCEPWFVVGTRYTVANTPHIVAIMQQR
jgi:hypothetical protein